MRSWLKPLTAISMTQTNAAWLAGFFDGEGSLCCYKGGRGGNYPSWILSVANTHQGSLERCAKITGSGRVVKKREAKSNHAAQYQWQIRSQRDIALICRQMLPFLTIKREKVEQFLEQWHDLSIAA